MTTSYPLVIKDLTFRYRQREEPAIMDINLQVEAGQVLLIAGASGCGKTTLARCINGLIPRSYRGDLAGTIEIMGQNIAGMPLARISQMVGTVLQDPERQILGTKVINEVAFGLENLALSHPEIIERVDEALAQLKISHLRERETFSLSGGEKQKVALAGVLAMRPNLLLLDEPLASLDPASAQETLSIVRQLADNGMTILMVEHRVEDVLQIRPENVIFMDAGQVRYYGPLEGLYRVVDYHAVKLPAEKVIERAAQEPPVPEPVLLPGGREPAAVQEGVESRVPASTRGNNGKTSGGPLVRFENVRFGYEAEQEVLHGINLEIKRGDVIAVLGPNGAGKTTLIKHAIGLLKPKGGHVYVQGRDTRELSVAQIASTLGYVFQSPSHMLFAPTVYDELAFGPTNLKHDPEEIRKEVTEAIEIVNLTGMEKYPPLAMSFGQQKRVSIAAILAMRSRILIMDEPTAGQDYQNYMDFMNAILQLPSFEAILFITHDIDLAVVYANRILLVNNGALVADGRPEEVLKDYELLRKNRLVPTSLLDANLERLPITGRFMRAEALAHLPQE